VDEPHVFLSLLKITDKEISSRGEFQRGLALVGNFVLSAAAV